MPHNYNRSAFETGRATGNPLLGLYCSLVTVELALKDSLSQWPNGHSIQVWLSNLNEAGLTSYTQMLATALQQLICTDRSGNESCVSINSYPDLRYLRHEVDFAGKTTNADIAQCISILDDIRTVLTRRGIL